MKLKRQWARLIKHVYEIVERGRCGFIGLTPALSGADLRVGEEA